MVKYYIKNKISFNKVAGIMADLGLRWSIEQDKEYAEWNMMGVHSARVATYARNYILVDTKPLENFANLHGIDLEELICQLLSRCEGGE